MLLSRLGVYFSPFPRRRPQNGMQDLNIDLRLAVNYLPACACALQSVALSFALCAVHSVRLLPAFVPVCMALVLHRASPRTLRIFDGSGVLFSIFLAHCVAAMQEFGAGWWNLWPPLFVALSVEWPAVAGYFLFYPPGKRSRLQACLACACVHASACGFLHRPEGPEYRVVRLARDLAFAGLCLVWTYVVGIYRRRLARGPPDAESSSHFAAYFWPVLYVHAYAAAAYALACVVVVASQLRPADPAPPQVAEPAQAPPPQQQQEEPAQAAPVEVLVLDPEDELAFRQAMSARQSAG